MGLFRLPWESAPAAAAPVAPPMTLMMSQERLLPVMLPYASFMALHLAALAYARSSTGPLRETPHTVGHFAATLFAFSLLAAVGVYSWNFTDLPVDHVWGFGSWGRWIGELQVAFMSYEMTAIAMARGREQQLLCGPGGIMIVHHVLVLALGWVVAANSFFHYYATFFFGVPELSSVPLAFMDLFKGNKELKRRYPAVNEAARNIFAAIFLVVRCVLFTRVAVGLWRDSLGEFASGLTGIRWALLTFVCSSQLVLLGMQYFWGSKIVRALLAMAKGKPPPKED